MLPLWIVDLRQKSERREIFENLLCQIDHVYMAISENSDSTQGDSCNQFESTAEDISKEADENSDRDVDQNKGKDIEDAEIKNDGNDSQDDVTNLNLELTGTNSKEEAKKESIIQEEISIEDQIEEDDQRDAERASYIYGYWWRYSPVADKSYGYDFREDMTDPKNSVMIASALYRCQTDLVIEGQKFIKALRESNAPPDIKVNVIVIGNLEETFTRVVMPSVAGLLQKEKGRILPNHIHQGMEIIGMLYVPSNINALRVDLRENMQRTLKEMDVQHKVPDFRGYDHVMLYQDVQNRSECAYPALNNKQLEEYLLQCIINLYYATNKTHPLLSGTAASEKFYFSMGATSVSYDVDNEDRRARHDFGINLMRSLKKEGSNEKPSLNLWIIKTEDYAPSSFFDYNTIAHINSNEIVVKGPKIHPIKQFYNKYLKRYYYGKYLKDFTKNLMHEIMSNIDEGTKGALEILASNAKNKFKEAKAHIFERIKETLKEIEASDGGFPTIIRLLKDVQDRFSAMKKNIQSSINSEFWEKVETDEVPKNMKDRFMEYHDAYEDDIRQKNGGVQQSAMKKEAVEDLNGLLARETPLLSRLCRAFLMGFMIALAVVPVLHLVSPHLLNLGRVRRYAEWWSFGLFWLPFIFEFISWWRYERKKRNAINNLKAIFLHDAYARIANRIESEVIGFYNKMIALVERYILRTETIRREIEKGYDQIENTKPVLPETKFNQSLLGGKFGRENLLPIPDAIDTMIKINFIPYKIGHIKDKQYYLFMREHYNLFLNLYRNVDLYEPLTRSNDAEGNEILVTREELENEEKEKWKVQLVEFQNGLSNAIKNSIVPRLNNSIGEFLNASVVGKIVRKDILKPMVQYAANNGEATSSADMELADLKINDARAVQYLFDYIDTPFKNDQVAKHDGLYKKYIFLTRWRSFDEFPLNRILPMEDFDEHIRLQRVYKEGKEAQDKIQNPEGLKQDDNNEGEEIGEYLSYPSTMLLWSLSPDDASSEWFRLIDSEFFAEAYNDKEIYKEIMNPND